MPHRQVGPSVPLDSLRPLLDALGQVGFCLIDLEGRITAWNPVCAELLGHEAAAVLGRQASDILPPAGADSTIVRSRLPLCAADGTPAGHAEILRPLPQAAPPERREARYQSLFDHAQIGILLADRDSRYIDANPAICAMLGHAREELVGMTAADILAEGELARVSATLRDLHAGLRHRQEWRLRRKDGTSLLAEVVVTPLPDGLLLAMLLDRSDRQQAERIRDHLAAIVESSSDAIVAEDMEGRILSWNAAAEAMFGYSAAEMVGAPITRLVPPDRQREAALRIDRLRRGERLEVVETQRRAKDGRLVDISVTTSPIWDAQGQVVGASRAVRDITTLRQRDREIARLSRLYAALSQVNQAIVWTRDRETLFQRICEALVTHGGFRMAWIGWQDASLAQLRPVAAHGVAERDVQRGFAKATQLDPAFLAFRSGETSIHNSLTADPAILPWRQHGSGREVEACAAIPIRQGGAVRGVLTVCSDRPDVFHDKEVALLEEAASDISYALDNQEREVARRAAEERLRHEKLFSDTIIESLPGILYFYDQDGRFLRWNRNFETISGYSAAEIVQMHPLDFFGAEDQPLLQQRIGQVFENGEAVVEAAFLSRDGTSHPYLFTGRRVEFEGRTCLIGAGIDLSDREKRHRAEAADRIKSAFLATMSHELRTPLNSIIGFTGILLQGLAGPLNTEQGKQLGMVQNSARHLLALVNDVLDISKIEAGQLEVEREPFDPRRAIDRVMATVAPQAAAKGLPLELVAPAPLGRWLGDARRFEQVLLNLLSNAIKFTDAGRVTLSAERLPGPPAMLRVTVADTGIGIRDHDLAGLFQPFRQIASGLARRSEGTGLGLAICRRLCELMGGSIAVESTPGQGSRFTVTLPLEDAA